MESLRNLPTLFRMVPFPIPYGLAFLKTGGSQVRNTHSKLQYELLSNRVLIIELHRISAPAPANPK